MTVPVLQALLVADQIYQDQATGKYVICGIFGTIFFHPGEQSAGGAPPASFHGIAGGEIGPAQSEERGAAAPGNPAGPSQHQMPINRLIRAGSPYAYVSLTEVHGSRMFQLRYMDLNHNAEIFSTQFGVDCRDPLETIQISLALPPLPVLDEGVFALELLCEGELLGSHRVLTKRHPQV